MEAEPHNAEPPKRKRRWFQFRLRTLMIGVTLLAVVCGYIAWQKKIVNERSSIIPAVVTTLPTTRAAGEFVQSPRRVVFDAAEVQVPIELVTFTPVVVFTSADGVRRRMTLDTGSDAVLVTPAFVAACRLATRPSNRSHRDASGTWAGTPVAILDKLDFGPVRFEDFDTDVVKLHIGSDGLLGWPLWRDVLLTIDYPRQMLILKRGSLPEPDGKRVLPLRLEHDRLMVQVTLDGREMWLNLDTGFGTGDSVDLTSARAAEVAWASPAVPTVAAHTPGGAVGHKVGRLKGDLVLGCYRFVQPVAGTNGGIAVDILGAWALANFTLALDLRNMRVAVRPPKRGADPHRAGVCGGFRLRPDKPATQGHRDSAWRRGRECRPSSGRPAPDHRRPARVGRHVLPRRRCVCNRTTAR